ncbi:MAG: hypothetical protein AAGG51_22965 [Cyanobacteria bacterium P01_G01_bin.54]
MTTLSRPPYQRCSAVTLMGIMVTLLVTACGESKVAQCNKLIEVINRGEEIDQKFEEETQALAGFEEIQNLAEFKEAAQGMSNAFGTIADEVDSYLEEVNAVELADEELVAYQATYAEQGQTFSGLIREASELFGKVSDLEVKPDGDPTPESAQQLMELAPSFQELDFQTSVGESSQDIDAVISDINTYCGVTPDAAGSEGE